MSERYGAKGRWLSELERLGLLPELRILLRVEDHMAEEEETRCIRVIGRFGTLLNVRKTARRASWRRELKLRGLKSWQASAA